MGINIVKSDNAPTKQVSVGNVVNTDKSGYFGLILNVNKNGKAIRIADRFNGQRVHILKSEVAQLIEALNELVKNGEPTSVKKVAYDKRA